MVRPRCVPPYEEKVTNAASDNSARAEEISEVMDCLCPIAYFYKSSQSIQTTSPMKDTTRSYSYGNKTVRLIKEKTNLALDIVKASSFR